MGSALGALSPADRRPRWVGRPAAPVAPARHRPGVAPPPPRLWCANATARGRPAKTRGHCAAGVLDHTTQPRSASARGIRTTRRRPSSCVGRRSPSGRYAMKRSIVLLPTLALVAALLLVGAAGSGHVAQAFDPTKAPEIQERLLDGLADFELDAIRRREGAEQAHELRLEQERRLRTQGREQHQGQPELPERDRPRSAGPRPGAERDRRSRSTRPTRASMVASFNDYRRGDGNCYARVQHRRRQQLERHDAADVVHARRALWRRASVLAGRRRHVGRVRHEGQRLPVVPDVHARRGRRRSNPDLSSAFFVFRSTGNDGASWNFPARPVVAEPGRGTAGTRRSSTSS